MRQTSIRALDNWNWGRRSYAPKLHYAHIDYHGKCTVCDTMNHYVSSLCEHGLLPVKSAVTLTKMNGQRRLVILGLLNQGVDQGV